MLKLTTDLVVLLCVLGSTAVVLLGWGNLTWRVLGVPRPSEVSVITIWLGFCIVVGCLEFIHLLVPIDWRVTVGVAIIGLLGQAGLFKSKATLLKPEALDRSNTIGLVMITLSAVQRYPWRGLATSVVIVTWCLRAMETPTMYDSGLYHFGSIRWLNEYPIVLGLGNLHWRLALNQSYFGFLGLLNFAPYWGKGYAAGGLFLLLLTAFTVVETGQAHSKRNNYVAAAVLFAYLSLLSSQVANPLPDAAVAFLQVAMFLLLYRLLINTIKTSSASKVDSDQLRVTLFFLCITIVNVKLSSVGFVMPVFLIACSPLFFKSISSVFSNSLALRSILVAVVIILVHAARGYLLSGAPFFPSPFGGGWSLPWAVDRGVAINESALIYAWAKQPGIGDPSDLPAGFDWIGGWLERLPTTFKYMLGFSSLLLLAAFPFCCRVSNRDNNLLVLGIPLIMGLLFWFFTAPDPRFLGAVGVLYFLWAVLVFQQVKIAEIWFYIEKKWIDRVVTFTAISVAFTLFIKWSLIPAFAVVGWSPIPSPLVTTESNRSGLSAYVPIRDSQCWAVELPCAVLLHDGLRLGRLTPFDSRTGPTWRAFMLER
jgi:hypothetical protein